MVMISWWSHEFTVPPEVPEGAYILARENRRTFLSIAWRTVRQELRDLLRAYVAAIVAISVGALVLAFAPSSQDGVLWWVQAFGGILVLIPGISLLASLVSFAGYAADLLGHSRNVANAAVASPTYALFSRRCESAGLVRNLAGDEEV